MPGPPIPFVGPDPHTLDAKQPPALPPLPGRDFQAAPMVAGSALPEEPKANFILEVLGKKADDLFRSCGDGSGHSTAAAKAKSAKVCMGTDNFEAEKSPPQLRRA